VPRLLLNSQATSNLTSFASTSLVSPRRAGTPPTPQFRRHKAPTIQLSLHLGKDPKIILQLLKIIIVITNSFLFIIAAFSPLRPGTTPTNHLVIRSTTVTLTKERSAEFNKSLS
jgi:hypothetical protein